MVESAKSFFEINDYGFQEGFLERLNDIHVYYNRELHANLLDFEKFRSSNFQISHKEIK